MSRYIDAEKLKCSIDSETDSIFDWDMTIEENFIITCANWLMMNLPQTRRKQGTESGKPQN